MVRGKLKNWLSSKLNRDNYYIIFKKGKTIWQKKRNIRAVWAMVLWSS